MFHVKHSSALRDIWLMGRAGPFAMQSSRSAGTCSRFDGLHQVDKLLARMNPCFCENALRVGPHGVLRYDQLFGHIRHIAATGKEVENLGLATRQTVTLDSNRAACSHGIAYSSDYRSQLLSRSGFHATRLPPMRRHHRYRQRVHRHQCHHGQLRQPNALRPRPPNKPHDGTPPSRACIHRCWRRCRTRARE